MRTLNSIFWTLILAAVPYSPVEAAIVLTGDHLLVGNQTAELIQLRASPSFAGEIAPGLNLNFVIDDGGSIVGGIDNNAPRITSINLKPIGGLFANIPDSQTNVLESQKLYQITIAPSNLEDRPEITENVLLAEVTLDTTGLTSGSWVLDLDGLVGVGLPSTDFAGLATTVNNGSVSIVAVPEPSGSLFAIAWGLVWIGRRHRR